MQKLNNPHRTLYRLLVSLSILVLWTGQAAMPAPQTTTPPTPAEESYPDWTAHRLPSLKDKPDDVQSLVQSSAMEPCYNISSKYNVTALIFSRLVYSSVLNEEIFVIPGICGGTETRITNEPGLDFEPRLNKDSTSVVFVSDRNSVGTTEIDNIYTMSIDGKNQKRITSAPSHDRMPTFSPDGRKIAFASDRSGNVEIYMVNTDGTGLVQVTNSAEVDVEPDWSPDGQSIAWMRRITNNTGVLSIMNADGSNQHSLLPPLPLAGRPIWSPDGKVIAFRMDSNNDGWYELGAIKSDGTGLTFWNFQKGSATTDLDLGGWLLNGDGLIYSATSYYYGESGWYLLATNILQVNFASATSPELLVNTMYTFDPHVSSLDNTPPISSITPLPEFSPAGSVKLDWNFSDNFSGVSGFSIQASTDRNPQWEYVDGAEFRPSKMTYQGTSQYTGQPGTTAYFKIQTKDWGYNAEPNKSAPDAWTRLYQWKGEINLTDARERPLPGVQVNSNPLAMNQPISGADGRANLYSASTGRYSVTYQKAGYALHPSQRWILDGNASYQTVLTGLHEQLQNGHFEDVQNPLAGWQASGDIPLSAGTGRISGQAARLGMLCSDAQCYETPVTAPVTGGASQPINLPAEINAPTLSFFYRIDSANANPESHFKVIFIPSEGQPVILFDRAAGRTDWAHAWVDLSPFLGQPGQLSFLVEQAQGELPVYVYIDEASVATWPTPILTRVSPNPIPNQPGAWVDLTGENFQPGVQVFLGGQPVASLERVSDTHLRLFIPPTLPAGLYPLKVVNPDNVDTQTLLYVGNPVFLPAVRK